MQEISFSIPVSGMIQIGEGSITIIVNRAETTVSFEPVKEEAGRISLGKGKTIFDVILETAREVVKDAVTDQFSAAELYHNGLERYPRLKRSTWNSHVIACAPNHPSHKHHGSHRDYFRYVGDGQYRLDPKYMPNKK